VAGGSSPLSAVGRAERAELHSGQPTTSNQQATDNDIPALHRFRRLPLSLQPPACRRRLAQPRGMLSLATRFATCFAIHPAGDAAGAAALLQHTTRCSRSLTYTIRCDDSSASDRRAAKPVDRLLHTLLHLQRQPNHLQQLLQQLKACRWCARASIRSSSGLPPPVSSSPSS
jgi:hypothetical protein